MCSAILVKFVLVKFVLKLLPTLLSTLLSTLSLTRIQPQNPIKLNTTKHSLSISGLAGGGRRNPSCECIIFINNIAFIICNVEVFNLKFSI